MAAAIILIPTMILVAAAKRRIRKAAATKVTLMMTTITIHRRVAGKRAKAKAAARVEVTTGLSPVVHLPPVCHLQSANVVFERTPQILSLMSVAMIRMTAIVMALILLGMKDEKAVKMLWKANLLFPLLFLFQIAIILLLGKKNL